MSDTTPPIPLDQWVHYYQQQGTRPPPVGELSDSTTVAVTGADNSSSTASGHQAAARPVRRRSRASRRTPTTLLNASATNFRALVQQFTGCQAAASSSLVPPGRGPVNLNFGRSSEGNDQLSTTTSVIAPSTFTYNYNNQHMPPFQQQQQQQQQQQYQDQQQRMLAYRESTTDPSHNAHNTLDDFVPENITLGEFIEQSTLARSASDGYFY